MLANRKNTLLIKAGGKGFLYEGVIGEGYMMCPPYIEHNFFERLLRELCFRVSFLPHRIWFNKSIKHYPADFIIVWDVLITVDFLVWLHDIFPNAQLNFHYANMIGKAKHLYPSEIPNYFNIWTYDGFDSSHYNLKLYNNSPYFRSFVKPKETAVYDVLFVGSDKGRGEYLLELESKMKSMGLRPHFVIVAPGKLSKKKDYYSRPLSYHEIVNLIVKSKVILNIAMDNQQGVTLRDMEALFFDVKLMTTNKNIVDQEFYHPNNVFVLEDMNIDELPAFIKKPYVPISSEIKLKHTFDSFIDEITRNGQKKL